MSPTIALLVTTVITVVLFHFLDWLFWGTPYARRNVYPRVPKELWRLPMESAGHGEAGKRAMLLGALVTTFVGILFVPMVLVLGQRFAGARVVLLAFLLWAVFLLPGAWYNSIYYRIPKQMMWFQAFVGLARVACGLVVVTWLLTTFNAW